MGVVLSKALERRRLLAVHSVEDQSLVCLWEEVDDSCYGNYTTNVMAATPITLGPSCNMHCCIHLAGSGSSSLMAYLISALSLWPCLRGSTVQRKSASTALWLALQQSPQALFLASNC